MMKFEIDLDMKEIIDEELVEDIQHAVRRAVADEYATIARQVTRKIIAQNAGKIEEQMVEAYKEQHRKFIASLEGGR